MNDSRALPYPINPGDSSRTKEENFSGLSRKVESFSKVLDGIPFTFHPSIEAYRKANDLLTSNNALQNATNVLERVKTSLESGKYEFDDSCIQRAEDVINACVNNK